MKIKFSTIIPLEIKDLKQSVNEKGELVYTIYCVRGVQIDG